MKRFFLLALIPCLCACSTAATKPPDMPVQHASPSPGADDTGKQAHDIILNHPSLSPKQRTQMLEVYTDVGRRSAELRTELGKLKAAFFRSLFNSPRNETELKSLKQKLLAANAKKMELMLNALEKAENVLAQGDTRQLEKIFYELDRLHRFDAILHGTP